MREDRPSVSDLFITSIILKRERRKKKTQQLKFVCSHEERSCYLGHVGVKVRCLWLINFRWHRLGPG